MDNSGRGYYFYCMRMKHGLGQRNLDDTFSISITNLERRHPEISWASGHTSFHKYTAMQTENGNTYCCKLIALNVKVFVVCVCCCLFVSFAWWYNTSMLGLKRSCEELGKCVESECSIWFGPLNPKIQLSRNWILYLFAHYVSEWSFRSTSNSPENILSIKG